MLNLQIFSDKSGSFNFCDYDWQNNNVERQSTAGKIFFCKKENLYLWKCGSFNCEKIVKAYRNFGEEFQQHLKPRDSSFVLYDAEKQTIFAVRDFVGKYPLFYQIEKGNLIFSFSINALLKSKLFEPQINYSKIVEFIDYDVFSEPNNETFYQNVYRVLPSCFIIASRGQIKKHERYGKFDLLKYQSFDDRQFVEKFRDVFIGSVRKSTGSYKKIGVSLSGGIDSSSICSVAQSIRSEPVYSFNFKPATIEAQEDEFIEAVIEKWKTVHKTVEQTFGQFEATARLTKHNAQPFFIFNSAIHLDFINSLKSAGCEMFLSGHFGDQVVGHGFQYFTELADKGDWKKLHQAIEQNARHSILLEEISEKERQSRKKIYVKNLLLNSFRKTKRWSRLPGILWALVFEFGYGYRDISAAVRRKFEPKKARFSHRIVNLIKSDILEKSSLAGGKNSKQFLKIEELTNTEASPAQQEQLKTIFNGNFVYGQEEYFEIYRQNELSSAQPFYDADLIELNLNVPLRVKFGEGLKRDTIRKALKDLLPEKILKRFTKADFTNHHLNLFRDFYKDFSARTSDSDPIWKIVDKNVFEENVKILLNESFPKDRYVLSPALKRVIELSIWLDYLEKLKDNS